MADTSPPTRFRRLTSASEPVAARAHCNRKSRRLACAAQLVEHGPVDADRSLQQPQRGEEAGAQWKERRGADPAANGQSERPDADRSEVSAGESHSAQKLQHQRHWKQGVEEDGPGWNGKVGAGMARPIAQPIAENWRNAPDENLE